MPFPATSLAHPSLSYRLTGALAEAASQRASGRYSVGYSLLFNRHGQAIASVRYYGDGAWSIFSGNYGLLGDLERIPGFSARRRFAQSLAAAEASAIIKEW